MPKTYSHAAQTGETAVATVHGLVAELGHVWHPRGQQDFGVDGEIELVDPVSRRALNRLLLAQVKGRSELRGETSDSFYFVCEQDHIDYWLNADVPVLLLVVKRMTKEAWWKDGTSWFSDPASRKTGRVEFDKVADRLAELLGRRWNEPLLEAHRPHQQVPQAAPRTAQGTYDDIMATRGSGEGDAVAALPLVLVAEDDARLRALFTTTIDRAGFAVIAASTGAEALQAASEHDPELVVLDIQMPEVDGLDVLTQLRRVSQVPVILVTGRGEEVDRVVGLELGADDYMVKPVYPRELVARVRAVLRRAPVSADSEILVFGGLSVDTAAREVLVAGEPVALTPREFDLLAFLAANPRRSVSRRELLEQVWESSLGWQDPSTVTEHVRRVRSKLDGAGCEDGSRIVTVRGRGYRFEP